ncbi:MAG TPA: hypothetical protein VFO41_16575 [Alphaproteobacteria bacterium]|nr:hypothetical protein [Alphaproteobacteria bacterium]
MTEVQLNSVIQSIDDVTRWLSAHRLKADVKQLLVPVAGLGADSRDDSLKILTHKLTFETDADAVRFCRDWDDAEIIG